MTSSTSQAPRSGSSPGRILVVDDDPIMREVMAAHFGEMGYAVTEAEHGEEACDLIGGDHFALAVIDLSMPKLDGFGLLRYIRQHPRTVDLPVIVVTSNNDEASIERAYDLGASSFVTKPVNWHLFGHHALFVMRNGETERALRTAEIEATSASKMKNGLFQVLSHELKTPLTAILGGLEIICDDNKGGPNELLEIVRDSALRLRDLIFDLLNLSKLESLKAQVKPTPCELRPIMENVKRMLPKHPLHNIEIDVPENLPPVLLDGEKVRTALSNYVSNAIKYSPKGGRVTMAARVEAGELVLEVSDEGMGISRENLDKLFKKFSRVNAAPEIEGTGLGLVIVKRIAELHDGYVFVQSVQGHGSTFGIRLPLKVA